MKLSLKSPARVYGGGYFMIDITTRKVVGESWFRTEATATKHWKENYKGKQPNVMVLPKASAFDFMVEQGLRFYE
jgi:hypothetical protein